MGTAPPPPGARAADDPMPGVMARAGNMMGRHADDWTPERAAAWEGMLELARVLRRAAEVLLEERHELGISMLGILGRLLRAPDATLRQTDLADAMGLSLSRVSRLIDALEARGLVARRPCPADARAVNVELTRAGRARATAAQDTVHAFVSERFMDPLTDEEIAVLAGAFTKLIRRAPRDPEAPDAA